MLFCGGYAKILFAMPRHCLMRKCWNRQTGTFEVRVSMTCGFKSHLPHQTKVPMAYPAMGIFVWYSELRTGTARPPAGGKKQSSGLFFSARESPIFTPVLSLQTLSNHGILIMPLRRQGAAQQRQAVGHTSRKGVRPCESRCTSAVLL